MNGIKMLNAKTIDNFLSQSEIDKILNFAKDVEEWEYGGSEFWNNRSLNAINIYENKDNEIGKLLYDIRERIQEEIKLLYSLENVYPDLTQIVRWFPGQEQYPHADDMTNTEGNDWFHHRHFGAIIYLNEDYSGGHTYYPQHNFEIVPKAGTLAVHPGDTDHLHGVTKIEDGIRYTIASFWTLDKEYFDGWKLP